MAACGGQNRKRENVPVQKLVPGFPGCPCDMAACPRLASLLPLSNLASGALGRLLAAELDDAFERALFVTHLLLAYPSF